MMIDLYDEKAKLRILSKIKVVGNCWIVKSFENKLINPFMSYHSKTILIFRLSYLLFNGDIKPSLVISHICNNILCVNPDHLEQITKKDCILKGQGPPAINKRKTFCEHGHSLTDNNLIIREKQRRQCRECKNQWMRNYRKRGNN